MENRKEADDGDEAPADAAQPGAPHTTGERAARLPLTTLERWAVALRVMAVVWWIGGVAYAVYLVASFSEHIRPWHGVFPGVAKIVFFSLLGGMLVYAFSYVLVGIDCLVENSAITAEAALNRRAEEEGNLVEEDNSDG